MNRHKLPVELAMHYRTAAGYPCGVAGRFPALAVRSTRAPADVTCRRCRVYLDGLLSLVVDGTGEAP